MLAGTLEIQLMAQLSRLASDMKQAETIVGGSMKSINSSVEGAKDLLKDFAAAFSIEKMMEYAKHVLETADNLGKMSQKIGISVEDLSKLRFAAGLSDLSLESMTKGMKKLSTEMTAASDPTSKQAKLMAGLGIDLKQGLMPALDSIADQFAGLPDGPTKAALAVELFGKAGMDMIPMLNKGSEGLREMKQEAERLGLVMTKEMAESAEKFNDNLKVMKFQTEAATAALLEHALPGMIRITEAMREASHEGGILWKVLIGIGGVMAEFIGLNDDGKKRMQNYIDGLKEERDGLESIKKATGSLLPGEQDRLELLNKQIESERILAEGRKKAAFDKQNDPMEIMWRSAVEIADNVMAQIKKSNEARTKALLTDKNGPNVYQEELNALDKKLAKLQGVGELEAYIKTLQEKKFATLTPAEKEELTRKQALIIKLEEENRIRGEIIKSGEAALAQEEKLKAMNQDYIDSLRDLSREQEFQLEMMGKTGDEAAKISAQRQMDLDLAKRIAAFEEKVGGELTAEQQATIANWRKMNEVAKEATAASMDRAVQVRNEVSAWNDFADRGARFFDDLLFSGKKAIDVIKDLFKSLLREMVSFFARKWILNLGANMSTDPLSASSLAGQAASSGASSMFGSLLGGGGSFLGYGTGSGMIGGASTFLGAASGSIPAAAIGADAVAAGVGVNSLAATSGAWMAGLSATGWGLIIVAAVAVLSQFFKSHGGPKLEGQFAGTYDSAGNLISSGRPLNIVGTGADAGSQAFVTSLKEAFFTALKGFGGTTAGVTFGGGVVRDPSGNSPTFVDTLVRSAAGQSLLSLHNANVGRSDEELQAELALQSQRAILAALQASELPARIATILDGLDPNTATLEEIQAAFAKANQAQAEFAAKWSHFEELFTTDQERLTKASKDVNDVFGKLGLSVPKSKQEFEDLVRSLDPMSVEGSKTIDALLGVQDAFVVLQDASAAAAEALKSDWEKAQEEIDRITGRDRSGSQLQSLVQQFQASNSWAGGQSVQQLIAALTTITEQDFANYSEENRKLILAILGLATGVKDLGGSVDTLAQTNWTVYQQTIGAAQDYARTWFSNLQTALADQDFPTRTSAFIGSLTTQIANTSAALESAIQSVLQQQGYSITTINAWKTQFGSLLKYWQQSYSAGNGNFPNIDAMVSQLEIYKKFLAEQSADLLKYWQLEAQYAGHGEQLLQLQKWYDNQKALIGNNATALEALGVDFQAKWDAIINGASDAAGGLGDLAKAIENAKENIRNFRDSLLLGQLSPLTATERWMTALDQYNNNYDLAKLNDAKALGDYSQIAQTLLQEAISYYGRASPEYMALFQQILADADLLGTPVGEDPVVTSVDAVRFTIEEQNRLLREQVAALTQQVVVLTNVVKTSGSATVNAIESSAATQPAPALT